MAKLTDLPVEILELILEDPLKRTETLCALNQVCKSIGKIANRLLYRNVVIRADWGKCNSYIPEHLRRTLDERPDLSHAVHQFDYNWECHNCDHDAILRSVLALMANLESLHLTGPWLNDLFDLVSHPAVRVRFLRGYVNPSLRKLTLEEGCKLFADDILELDVLPNLSHLRVTCVDDEVDPFSMKTLSIGNNKNNNFIAASSKPLSLDLGTFREYNFLSLQSFKRILQKRPSVVKLATGFPGVKQDYGQREDCEGGRLSPRSFGLHIRALSATLKELKIDAATRNWMTHDNSRLDLSPFTQLVKLSVPADCYFTSELPDPTRHGIAKLLPPSLVTLEIVFVRQGIFCFGWSPKDFYEFEKQGCIASPDTYSWIQELVVRKSTHFPNLDRVKIRQLCLESKSAIWELPEPLKSLTIDASVELCVIWKRSSYAMHPERHGIEW